MSGTEQLDLLSYTPPLAVRASDPLESYIAAERAQRGAHTLRSRCLDILRAHPDGLTDFELAELVHRQQTSAGKRRGELVQMGLVVKTELTRPAPSGSPARVWKAVVADG